MERLIVFATHEGQDHTAWCLHEGGTVLADGATRGNSRDALSVALDALASEPGQLAVYVMHTPLRRQLIELGAVGRFRFAVASEYAAGEEVRVAVNEALRATVAELEPPPKLEVARVVVACDGSANRSGAAAAWVSDQGRFSGRRLPGADINEAELTAVADALAALSDETSVIVLSDSRVALAVIAGERPAAGRAATIALARIRHHEQRLRRTRFVWTKAHRDPGLHDAADRLARMVLRFGDEQIHTPVAQRIVAESLAVAA